MNLNLNYLNGKRFFRLSPDKILFGVACVYLLTVIFWLAIRGKTRNAEVSNLSQTTSSQERAKKDAEFIAYLQTQLEIIEKKQKQQQNQSTPSPTVESIQAPSPPTPIPPLSRGDTEQTQTTPQIVEKIYIPVYPQNNMPVAVNPSVTKVTPQSSKIPPPPPIVSPAPKSVSLPTPTSVPVLKPQNSLNNLNNLNNLAPPPPIASSTSPQNHLLVGLLEAGDKSSALFTINGQTQRIQVGESIGASGWILQSVQNQQALLFRNGSIRSLPVGQGF